jgi:hypothetical protein
MLVFVLEVVLLYVSVSVSVSEVLEHINMFEVVDILMLWRSC